MLRAPVILEATRYVTTFKVQVFLRSCFSLDETLNTLILAVRESLNHILYMLNIDHEAYYGIICKDIRKYHDTAYGLKWWEMVQSALQITTQVVQLVGVEHLMDMDGIGHLTTHVCKLTNIKAELESTIVEQNKTISELLRIFISVLLKPKDQWFERAHIVLGNITALTINNASKLIQVITTNTSTLWAFSQHVEGLAAVASGFALVMMMRPRESCTVGMNLKSRSDAS
ncbi:hypothetical protein AcV7_002523 [Taiwanofungus camphoratus]|nr:hypothetical protein AcV7_002523 [Antrodia cinnamomea]